MKKYEEELPDTCDGLIEKFTMIKMEKMKKFLKA